MGSSIPQPLEYICSGGDSGGGLFREGKNGWELIGLCSGAGTNMEMLLATGYYGQTMNWTRVSTFNDWIKQSIKEF
jgi:secreted trypsin-like serine protease